VKGLSKQFDGITYLTARNVEAGQKAVEELKKEGYNNVHFHQLDITDKNSIATFKSYLQNTYGGIDILVNNAGIGVDVSIYCNIFALTVINEIRLLVFCFEYLFCISP
jgi:NAD(P)-dependent dehydrogenase (short-subunit alcohol dehydrogenase family)